MNWNGNKTLYSSSVGGKEKPEAAAYSQEKQAQRKNFG